MCLKLLRAIFKPRLVIPHPEEPPDYTQMLENVSIASTLEKWFEVYQVPVEWWDFWRTQISIEVRPDIPYPAQTWEQDGIRRLAVRPEWLNPGIIAHEQAHNSYSLLTPEQKAEFAIIYAPLKNTDPLIKLLYSKNTYGLTNDVEGMAEIYRYLGDKVPEVLKPFYPKLFDI